MKWWRILQQREVSKPDGSAPAAPVASPVAIISDVHANLPALEAVMKDIEAQGIHQRICLGDIVGYGGNPAECVKLVQASGFECIRGNHDSYASEDAVLPRRAEDFAGACQWMRLQLGPETCRWLTTLPFTLSKETYEATHTSLYHPPEWRYVLMDTDAVQHFEYQVKPLCFAGHTHQPKLWTEGEDRPVPGFATEKLRPNLKQLVNVGSVGQPRDGDPRACYVVYRPDTQEITWRRVDYDIDRAQKAILYARLPAKYAGRLEFGK